MFAFCLKKQTRKLKYCSTSDIIPISCLIYNYQQIFKHSVLKKNYVKCKGRVPGVSIIAN